jgi:sugar-specific transcriptional regulator TrmB
MLEKEFSHIGLNSNEREVYLAVLRAGKCSQTRIAKETGINRTTVYSVAKKLTSLGLISEDLTASTAYLYANPPESLTHLFIQEEKELQEKKIIAEKMARELAKLPQSLSYSVPKIRFIEESDLSEFLYGQHDTWMESGHTVDATWWGYHDSSVTRSYGDWIKWSWKRTVSKDTKVRFFSNDDKAEDSMNKVNKERQTKTLPSGAEFDSSTWVVGDYTIMVQTRQKPHYLVEMHDAVFARNQRELFKAMWGLTK